MTTSDYTLIIIAAVQAVAMMVLVGVTIYYAAQTRRTAEEMKLQRLAAKPVVVPDINVHPHEKSYADNMQDIAQGLFPVALTNVGTAAAIELELSLKVPPESRPTRREFISAKLPLLLPGADWRRELTYVADFSEKGDPIFGMPPPEGLYELKVTFRSATSNPDWQPSEVTLPFYLHWSGEGFWWEIKRHKLIQKLENA